MTVLALLLQLMVPFTTVIEGEFTGIDGPREVVIRTQEEWVELWRQHGVEDAVPRVDFSTQTLLGVFLGTRASAGFKVEITGIRRDQDEIVVEYLERRPNAGMIAAAVLTMPFHVVRVERLEGPIKFVRADLARGQ